MTKPIPDGFHTATPSLVVSNAREAIEFYKKAFDANEIYQFPAPDGKIMHAMIQIGDSFIMMSDEFPGMGCSSPTTIGPTRLRYPRSRGGGSGNHASQLHRNDMKIRFGV